VSGNEVSILQPEERLAVALARNAAARSKGIGPNVTAALVATIERLSQSPSRRHMYWLTEKAERALDGAS